MRTKLLLIFFVFAVFFKTDTSFNQDLGRHIKLGEIITKTGSVPKINLFSYTNPDFPFINTHWLFEVLTYLASQTTGIYFLLILKLIVVLLSVWLILKIIPEENSALLLPIGFIFLHVLRERTELRPEILSFFFTALTIYILELYTSLRGVIATKVIFLLPLIQLIWINTHIYFFVGLVLQAIYLIQRIGAKLVHPPGGLRWHLLFFIFVASVLVSLLNPNGLSGILYPLNVSKNYGYTVVENQTMFWLESIGFQDQNFLFVKLAAGLIVLSLIITFIRRRFDIKSTLLALFGLALALLNVRSFPYLVFISLPAVIMSFGPIKKTKLTLFLSLITCFLLLYESFFYLNGNYYKYHDSIDTPGLRMEESGKGAMDFVLAKHLPGPIYNNFDIGSYIIYRGYPKYQVFVDGRPEAYPADFFQNIYIPTEYDYNKFKNLDQQYHFQTVIFSYLDQTPWGKAFLQEALKDQQWKLVYLDDFMLILVKSHVVTEKNLSVIDLSRLQAANYHYTNHLSYLRIGLFLLGNKYRSGGSFIQKTLQIFPEDPIANSIIGNPISNNFFW